MNQSIPPATTSELETLHTLNHDYIASVQRGDARRFDQILAGDFCCTNPDGTLVNREAFLAQTAQPVTIRDLRAHDVTIRLFGDTAIIHARTTFARADGSHGAGRYTDVWHRQNGAWHCVSAHVTRL